MPCPQRQILQHSQVWKNTPAFKDVSDAQTCPHVRWSGLETRSVEANFACLGGEQQMLALGRGLMALPRLLMVDEPFLGLAPGIVEQMKSVFQALQAEGIAILFIEQNVRLALSMAGRGYILESGRLAIEGEAPTLIDSPEVRRIFLGG